MIRRLLSSLVLLTLLAAVVTLAWLGGSESGARVTIAYISGITPGFSMRHDSGTLVGPLQLRRIVVKNPKVRVDIDALYLDWSPGCLLVGEGCLREVRVQKATVTLAPPAAATANGERRRLPAVTLPLSLDVSRLTVDTLDVVRSGKTTRFTGLEASLAWQDNDLRVDRLVIGMPGWEASAAGSLATQGDWPLTASLGFVTPRSGVPVFSMRGTGSGSLMDARLELDSDGLLQAGLSGHMQPLERGLPFSATLTADAFRIPPRGNPEKSAQLQDIRLTGQGELLGNVTLAGSAVIDTPWTPPLPARLLQASGTWRGIDNAEVRIEDPRLLASIISDYHWLGGQQFRATVSVDHLDLSLVNKATPSRLAGNLQVDGTINKEGTRVDIGVAALDGSFRQWPLATRGPLQWRDSHWVFNALQLRIGANNASITGTLADHWDANATLALDDLHTLVPAFEGRANGSARISGAPTDPQLALTLTTRDMLLPAVTLPAPLARKVRLPPAAWQITGTASLGNIALQEARTQPGQRLDMRARGHVGWAGPLRWDITSEIDRLALGDLLPELIGDVHGSFASRGEMATQLMNLQVDAALSGESLGVPLRIDGTLEYTPQALRVDRFAIAHGDNRANLSAAIDTHAGGDDDDRVALSLEVAAPVIGNSLRDFAGAAQVSAQVSGTRARPDVQIRSALDSLAWQDFRVGRLVVDGDVRDGFFSPSTLMLAAENVTDGKQVLESAGTRVEGTRAAHRLAIDAQAGPLAASANLSGTLTGTRADDVDWRGRLDDGDIRIDDWRWTSAGTPDIHYRDAEASVAPHCWTDGEARACLTTTAGFGSRGHLDAEIFHLPFESLLGDLLPIDTLVEGKVGSTLSLAWEAPGLSNLRADLRNEGSIRLALVDDDETRTLGRIDTLQLNATLDERAGELHGSLRGEHVGNLQAGAMLGPGAVGELGNRALRAHVQANDIQFALLEAFTYQLRDTAGAIDGSVNVTGTPANPRYAGRIDLTNGRTGFTRLPVNLVDINLGGRFSGEHADFSGSLRTAESTGKADIDGSVRFSGKDWQADGRVTGNGLVFASLPEYHFTTAPDLQLSADAQHLGIAGTVRVPAGRIEMKALPAQSVRRSRDVVLVGDDVQAPESGFGLRQHVDVDFVLGDDVLFRAFGGEGRLGGDLRVRSTPELPLLVNGELHVYEGKYAAFGQSLALKQADIIFNGPADQPLIDALAVRSFDESAVREVGLRLTGSLRAPQTTLWSTPTLPDEEALSWLATGRPLSDGPINLRGEAAQAALSLGVAQGSALLTAAGQEIGLQDVQLATGGDGENAEVQVGTNVNEKIFVGYNRRVFTGDESVLLRLHLTRRLMLEALSGLDSALDIFYTFEF